MKKVGSISRPTSMKALPAVNGSPSFQTVASGLSETLAGAGVTSFATCPATLKTNGAFCGGCPDSGVIMAAGGMAAFRTTGTGCPTADGGFSFGRGRLL